MSYCNLHILIQVVNIIANIVVSHTNIFLKCSVTRSLNFRITMCVSKLYFHMENVLNKIVWICMDMNMKLRNVVVLKYNLV
jgi:hypothetical protein